MTKAPSPVKATTPQLQFLDDMDSYIGQLDGLLAALKMLTIELDNDERASKADVADAVLISVHDLVGKISDSYQDAMFGGRPLKSQAA